MKWFAKLVAGAFLCTLCGASWAQSDGASAPPAAPAGDTPPAAETPAGTEPSAPAPVSQAPTSQAPTPSPAPAAPAPEPTPAAAPPVVEPAEQPAADNTQAPDDEPYEPPPPPDPADEQGSGIPPFSIRVDPFNWLLAGRLGLELEVGVWEFISAELVPIFVTSESPPWFNFAGRDDNLTQHSDGLGPISGTSLGVGFWFGGKPFKGTVLRAIFSNYAYDYQTPVASLGHTEQRLGATIGSLSRYGAFTIGGEFGLTHELNDEERCVDPAEPSGCGELQLPADATSYYDLNGPFHPIYLEFRFSLGVTID